jgi:hypothetical protein
VDHKSPAPAGNPTGKEPSMERRILYKEKTYVRVGDMLFVRFKRYKKGKRPLIVTRRLQHGRLWNIIADQFDSQIERAKRC